MMSAARRVALSALGFLAVVALACTSYEVIRPPLRNADLYPLSQTRQEIAVAIDQIRDPGRVKRYFGVDLTQAGILPVQVIVSNQGDGRVRVTPADVLLLSGNQVVDPVPLARVVDLVGRDGLVTTDGAEQRIAEYFAELALRDRVLAPGETHHGIVFFQTPQRRRGSSRFFRVASLFPQPSLRLNVVATDLDAEERIHFGPFGLSTGERGI